VIDLSLPTVVLLGSPNVGKSSIVRAVSSGTPEVNDYPFTTRGVSVGHIIDKDRDLKFQVMDTPGLLDRPDVDRNEMEKLTYASLAHLPTAAIFVIDPSGLSGVHSSLEAQLNVRKALKARFPRRPWLDVISKGDLSIPQHVLDQLPPDSLTISVRSGLNMDIFKRNIEDTLLYLGDILKASPPS
jgi:nucleolar GTP-binding protein